MQKKNKNITSKGNKWSVSLHNRKNEKRRRPFSSSGFVVFIIPISHWKKEEKVAGFQFWHNVKKKVKKKVESIKLTLNNIKRGEKVNNN
jgi:hypothetical protein